MYFRQVTEETRTMVKLAGKDNVVGTVTIYISEMPLVALINAYVSVSGSRI